jgi:cell division protein FtsA
VRRTQSIITGLDVGTTKICAVIGEVTPTGVDVIGIGQHPSRGLRKGVVANVESTVEAIKRAISEAEQTAGVEVDAVYVSIGEAHPGINRRRRRAGGGRSPGGEPAARQILTRFPGFTVDDQTASGNR